MFSQNGSCSGFCVKQAVSTLQALVVWLHNDIEDPTNGFFSSLTPGDVLLKHRAQQVSERDW